MRNPKISSTANPVVHSRWKADFNGRCAQLLASNNRAELEQPCRQLLRDYPREALAHFLMARMFVDSKRLQSAFPYAEAAHKLAPQDSNFTYYLGFLYLESKLYEFALPLLRKAVKDHSSNAQVFHESLGDCYYELGNGAVAIEYYQKARSLADVEAVKNRCSAKLLQVYVTADMTIEAQNEIKNLKVLSDTGFYRTAIRQEAWISRDGAESTVGRELRAVLDDASIDEKQKVETWLAYGRLHEKDKNYDKAFECWIASREIAKLGGGLILRSREERQEQFLSIKAFYTPEHFQALEAYGHQTDMPVFVVGMPRSGTTLTEQIIAAHPQAVGVGELARFGKLDSAFRHDYPEELRIEKMLRNAELGELQRRAEETLRIFDVVAEVKRDRVVEKTPHNFATVGYLRTCFPRAKFIHCFRHPLDTFISSYQNSLNSKGHAYSYDQVTYLTEYLYHVDLMNYWKSVFPDQILTLHYENLATDPETWARNIIAFVGLPWHDDCLRFFEKAKTVRTISNQQVRNPVYTTSVARWKRYEKHLGPILKALEESGFKYPVVSAS